MLKSNASNIFNPWNFQFLKKIINIPEDQLNALSNIPEWQPTECTSFIINTYKETAKKDKKSSESQNKEEENCSASPKNTNLEETETSKGKLSSHLNSNNSSFSDKPHIVAELSHIKSNKMESFKKIIREIGELNAIDKELDSLEAQFTDSAIQCHMSQSSQPNLDLSLASRVALSPVSSVCEVKTINTDDDECHDKTDDRILKESNGINNVLEIANAMTKVKSIADNTFVVHEDRQSLNEKRKEAEESFLSLPIPCAQPASVDLLKENTLVSSVQNLDSFSTPNAPIEIHEAAARKSHSVKRKSKSKLEKSSKKLRILNPVIFSYSAEQINSMLDIMKILNEV